VSENTITVYWTSGKFNQEEESWNGLYFEPDSLLKDFISKGGSNNEDGNVFQCPASNDLLKNIYVLRAPINDKFLIESDYLDSIQNDRADYHLRSNINSISFGQSRKTFLKDYYDIEYNLGWLMLADESVEIEFTAPYFPCNQPADGVILSAGRFDIGKWFRPLNLNYFVPKNTEMLEFKENEPLCYIKFNTDKKIVFKRFTMNKTIELISKEFVASPRVYGRKLSLLKRYERANKTSMIDVAIAEIKKNLVD